MNSTNTLPSPRVVWADGLFKVAGRIETSVDEVQSAIGAILVAVHDATVPERTSVVLFGKRDMPRRVPADVHSLIVSELAKLVNELGNSWPEWGSDFLGLFRTAEFVVQCCIAMCDDALCKEAA